jgi:hypothetical protein
LLQLVIRAKLKLLRLCPCPLAGLLQFVVEAIEAVDERRKSRKELT